MPEMKKLLDEYRITAEDLENLRAVAPVILENRDHIADAHYERLFANKETARFFKEKGALERARLAFIDWLTDLVSGEYTASYLIKLNRIGGIHVRIKLPAHQVNLQIAFVRGIISDLICKHFHDNPQAASRLIASMDKMLDLNLDLMTRSYREEELRVNFLSYKLDSSLIRAAKWCVNGFNMVLVFGLLITGLLVLGLCASDIGHIASGGLERGVLGALGSLLILWVVIELLDTQIGHIKGHAFAIKVFVSVALVAELRKILMLSIGHGDVREQAALVASVLVLGLVYWLISKVEPH